MLTCRIRTLRLVCFPGSGEAGGGVEDRGAAVTVGGSQSWVLPASEKNPTGPGSFSLNNPSLSLES